MPKVACGHCSYILNLSSIPNPYEFDSIPSTEVDNWFKLLVDKISHHSNLSTQLAIVSDLWSEKSFSFLRCPNCGSIIVTGEDGTVETYVKIAT